MKRNEKVMNALYLGSLCSIAYLAVYIARNILGAATPQLIENGISEAYIGRASSFFFIFYAAGQLINGVAGDKIKAKTMICTGLLVAAVTNFAFSRLMLPHASVALILYALTGFCLAMIYPPMNKLVAENTEPIYAVRCSLGYSLASFFGSPVAGVLLAFMVWQHAFITSSLALGLMAVVCFICFIRLEKKGVITYHQYDHIKQKSGGIKILIQHDIIKFTIVAFLTGIIRTTVVFWMPTYTTQHLGFTPEQSAIIFTAATLVISLATFLAVFIYERLRRNLNLSVLVMFSASAMFFALLYCVQQPVLNIIFLTLAITTADAASAMMFSIYCPGLRDTGMVSAATGFLDCVSYVAAALSSTLFAGSASETGWGNLILVWCGLMLLGVIAALPYHTIKRKRDVSSC